MNQNNSLPFLHSTVLQYTRNDDAICRSRGGYGVESFLALCDAIQPFDSRSNVEIGFFSTPTELLYALRKIAKTGTGNTTLKAAVKRQRPKRLKESKPNASENTSDGDKLHLEASLSIQEEENDDDDESSSKEDEESESPHIIGAWDVDSTSQHQSVQEEETHARDKGDDVLNQAHDTKDGAGGEISWFQKWTTTVKKSAKSDDDVNESAEENEKDDDQNSDNGGDDDGDAPATTPALSLFQRVWGSRPNK